MISSGIRKIQTGRSCRNTATQPVVLMAVPPENRLIRRLCESSSRWDTSSFYVFFFRHKIARLLAERLCARVLANWASRLNGCEKNTGSYRWRNILDPPSMEKKNILSRVFNTNWRSKLITFADFVPSRCLSEKQAKAAFKNAPVLLPPTQQLDEEFFDLEIL